jgi:hypothetical protein
MKERINLTMLMIIVNKSFLLTHTCTGLSFLHLSHHLDVMMTDDESAKALAEHIAHSSYVG